jgi:leucyl/phenylalanyl-tRNA--protein transferase
MINAYSELHRLGVAHSVETWRDGELVGGLYGVSLGRVFFGESMFSHTADASKVALVQLAELTGAADFALIDCQVYTGHLERLGAQQIPRQQFQELLQQALAQAAFDDWRRAPRPAATLEAAR